MVPWMLLGFCRTVMCEKSPASFVEKHKHTMVFWNQWCTPCLQQIFVLHIAIHHKNASTIQYTMHKRTSTNKNNRLGGRSFRPTDKSFKIDINANSKQHEQNFVVFMHVEETSHPPQWRPALLVSTNKTLVIVHTLKERLGENKEPTRAPFGELLQLLCKTSWRGRRWLPHNSALWMVEILLVDEIDDCRHCYLTTP
jgi:hypothetical protein